MGALTFFAYASLGLGPGFVFFFFFIAPKSFLVLLSFFRQAPYCRALQLTAYAGASQVLAEPLGVPLVSGPRKRVQAQCYGRSTACAPVCSLPAPAP